MPGTRTVILNSGYNGIYDAITVKVNAAYYNNEIEMRNPNFAFYPDPRILQVVRELYQSVTDLPILSPHSHVPPSLFSSPNAGFGTPTDLFVIPDHYVTRMFCSQGIVLDELGIKEVGIDLSQSFNLPHDQHRKIWRLFCENFFLFRGTQSGIWLAHELSDVFGLDEKPSAETADRLYDSIVEKLASIEYTPRALFERFNIQVLCTTDSATDMLDHHRAIRESGWHGRVLPTFRPDSILDLEAPNWRANIDTLGAVSGTEIVDFRSYIRALEQRREYFQSMGAVASDHSVLAPATAELSPMEAETIFQRALKGQFTTEDATRFTAHMMMEMARMSIEDGLVMQLHPGSLRNHNQMIFQRFGPDNGADIPVQTEYTRNLRPLLNKYGNDSRLTLILFTLDETTYGRELAPLAGHYPALKLGSPWWFHDSLNGMGRYFDQVMETAGIYNTAGFNDDTRAFCSIPARHDVWRRASANWVAGLVARHIVDLNDAREMIFELTIGLARRAYKIP
jgi:glucuronate isomerase